MSSTAKKQRRVCLVAVDVRSAHNIGAFFRTCDGFGAELALVGACPRPAHDQDDRLPYVTKKATASIAKTALGTEKVVKWRYFPTFFEAIKALRKDGFVICALEQTGKSKQLREITSEHDVALVVGREVEGLSSDEVSLCDQSYEIPMNGQKESFNVSVASGIGLYELTR